MKGGNKMKQIKKHVLTRLILTMISVIVFPTLIPSLEQIVHAKPVYRSESDYILNESADEIEIKGYNGESKEVEIPARINEKPVTSIGAGAFSGKEVTSVKIPVGVTSIGEGAFSGTKITSIKIPIGVTSIGKDAFRSSLELTHVEIPESVTSIGSGAFFYCDLSSLEIPPGITIIEEETFRENPKLTSLVIPVGVTSIGKSAFDGCHRLASVVIPEGVTDIGDSAFFENDLTSIEIPAGITRIGNYTFATNLLTSIEIPEGVTDIGDSAFYQNQLSSIEIPAGVISIGDYAFYQNELSSVVIPESVTSLGKHMLAINKTNPRHIIIYGKEGSESYKYANANNHTFISRVKLNRKKLTLIEEETESLLATVLPKEAGENVSWTSDNESIARVDEDGKVTAVRRGETTIRVITEDEKHTEECEVRVFKPANSVSLNKEEINLIEGESEILIATVSPEGSSQNVRWTSDDESIARVDEEGRVFAQSQGETTITVTAETGGYTETCKVTVVKLVESVSLDKTNLTLIEGDTETLIATISPTDATNQKVTWISSNESIARVDEEGTVTGIAEGISEPTIVTITVSTEDGGHTAECTVKVKPIYEYKIIEIDNKIEITKYNGTGGDIIIPEKFEEKLVVSIAEASFMNKEITSVKISEKVNEIGDSAFLGNQLTSIEIPSGVIIIGQAAFKGNHLTSILIPEGVTEIGDEAFSENQIENLEFIIYGKRGHKSEAYATTNNHTFIRIISLNKTNLTLRRGRTESLTAKISPEGASQNVIWESDDTSIVKVDEEGKVTGEISGETIIRVTTEDGKHTEECKVLVRNPVIPSPEPKLDYDRSEAIVLNKKTIQDKEKTWTIKFNKEILDGEYLKEGIHVVDEDKFIQKVKFKVGEGGHSIIVTPPISGYRLGKTYTVVIRGIKDKDGNILKDMVIMDFTMDY